MILKLIRTTCVNITTLSISIAMAYLLIILSLASSISAQEETPIPMEKSQIAFISNLDVYMMLYSDATPITQLTSIEQGWSDHPDWSPDGYHLVFDAHVSSPPNSSNVTTDIFIVNVETQETFQITESSFDNTFPVWSPDAEHIAFVSNRDGNWEIYIMDTDGNNQTRVTNNDATDGLNGLAWSPDGHHLAFISDRDEGRNPDTGDFEAEQIYVLDVEAMLNGDTTKTILLSKSINVCPTGEFYRNLAWSVNDQLAFALSCSAYWDIYVADISQLYESENEPQLFNLTQSSKSDGTLGLDWSADGTELVYVSSLDEDFDDLEIFILDVVQTMKSHHPQITQITNSPAIRSSYAYPTWIMNN